MKADSETKETPQSKGLSSAHPSTGGAGGGHPLGNRGSVVPYKAEHAYHFARLNKAWIEKYFVLEDLDRWVLENPLEAILAKGGAIFMATVDGVVAGTVALIKVNDEEFELSKMAVDEAFQRRGLAEALTYAAFDRAREIGARKLSLYSQTELAPAIQLYRKLGFAEVPMDHQLYKRANIKMEIELAPQRSGDARLHKTGF